MAFFVQKHQQRLLVLGLIGIAATLRFWNLTNLGLTHFDEGSYAMTGRWLATFGHEGWMFQPGHAPPLYPTFVGLFFLIFGISDYVAISVSALVGSLTVGLMYLFGQRAFGPRTGVLTALLLATAEYHIIFSRLALTDALFTLFFWTALACFYRGFETKQRGWFVLAGLATGLCWNTKYHGFLPLVIAGVWAGAEFARNLKLGRQRAWQQVPARNLSYSAGLALLLYLPWFFLVELSVGYGNILSYQAAYFFHGTSVVRTSPGVLLFYSKQWLAPSILLTAGLGTGIWLLQRTRALSYILLSLFILAVAPLFYMSFPRLLLPLVPGLCLLSAIAVGFLTAKLTRLSDWAFGLAAVVMLLLNLLGSIPVLTKPTSGYRNAAAYIGELDGTIISQLSKNYYFYEKKKSFEIRRHELPTLDSLLIHSRKAFVAIDPILLRFPEKAQWLERRRADLVLVKDFELPMYEPVYYQGFDPRQSWDDIAVSLAPFRPGDAKLEIYRRKGKHFTKR